MSIQSFIVLLGANQYLRERALKGAREVTDALIFIADKNAKLDKNRYFDGALEADSNDTQSLIKCIQEKQSQGFKLLSVIPLNDWVLKTANAINAFFNLPHLSSEVIENARNKYKMKCKFKEHNVPSSPFFLLNSENELAKAIEIIGFPMIIKPYDFGGSGGVYLAQNPKEASEKLALSKAIVAQYKNAFKIAGDKYLIEKYIDTQEEVSVEILCFKDKCITLSVTEKYLSPKPYFSEMAHLVPSHRNLDKKLNQIAHSAALALGIDKGLAHVEIKILEDSYWVIEVGARTGGDGILDQVEKAFGINPYALHIASYLGRDLSNFQMPEPKGSAFIGFLKAKEGKIQKIHYPLIDDLHKELESIKITAKEGDIAKPPQDWSAREGVVEFYYPNQFFKEKTNLPLELLEKWSAKIFES